MSPVARSTGHAGRALLVATVAVIVVMGVLFAAAWAFGRQDAQKVQLGDQTFGDAHARSLAAEIRRGGPVIFPDVAGKDRDIIVQHLGSNPRTGWYAIRARVPHQARDCTWKWQADRGLFVASCDAARTAPADGRGLQRYPVRVVADRLDIDLNYADRTTTTTAPPTTVRESGG